MATNSWQNQNCGSGRNYLLGSDPHIRYDDDITIISKITEGLREFIHSEPAVRLTLDTPKGLCERSIIAIPFSMDQELVLFNFATLIFQSLMAYYVNADPNSSHHGISNRVMEGNMNSLLRREMEKLINQFQARNDMAGHLLKNLKMVGERPVPEADNVHLAEVVCKVLDIHAGYRILAKGVNVNCSRIFIPVSTGTDIIALVYRNIEQMMLHNFVSFDETGNQYLRITESLVYRDLESILRRSKEKENTRRKILNNLQVNTIVTKDLKIQYHSPTQDQLYDILNQVQDTKIRKATEKSNVLYSTNVLAANNLYPKDFEDPSQMAQEKQMEKTDDLIALYTINIPKEDFLKRKADILERSATDETKGNEDIVLALDSTLSTRKESPSKGENSAETPSIEDIDRLSKTADKIEEDAEIQDAEPENIRTPPPHKPYTAFRSDQPNEKSITDEQVQEADDVSKTVDPSSQASTKVSLPEVKKVQSADSDNQALDDELPSEASEVIFADSKIQSVKKGAEAIIKKSLPTDLEKQIPGKISSEIRNVFSDRSPGEDSPNDIDKVTPVSENQFLAKESSTKMADNLTIDSDEQVADHNSATESKVTASTDSIKHESTEVKQPVAAFIAKVDSTSPREDQEKKYKKQLAEIQSALTDQESNEKTDEFIGMDNQHPDALAETDKTPQFYTKTVQESDLNNQSGLNGQSSVSKTYEPSHEISEISEIAEDDPFDTIQNGEKLTSTKVTTQVTDISSKNTTKPESTSNADLDDQSTRGAVIHTGETPIIETTDDATVPQGVEPSPITIANQVFDTTKEQSTESQAYEAKFFDSGHVQDIDIESTDTTTDNESQSSDTSNAELKNIVPDDSQQTEKSEISHQLINESDDSKKDQSSISSTKYSHKSQHSSGNKKQETQKENLSFNMLDRFEKNNEKKAEFQKRDKKKIIESYKSWKTIIKSGHSNEDENRGEKKLKEEDVAGELTENGLKSDDRGSSKKVKKTAETSIQAPISAQDSRKDHKIGTHKSSLHAPKGKKRTSVPVKKIKGKLKPVLGNMWKRTHRTYAAHPLKDAVIRVADENKGKETDKEDIGLERKYAVHPLKKRFLLYPYKSDFEKISETFKLDSTNMHPKAYDFSRRIKARRTYVPHPLEQNPPINWGRRHYDKGPQKVHIAAKISSNTKKNKD